MIFVDTNVVSETTKLKPDAKVMVWLTRHDAEIALSSIVIAEMAFGIERIRPDERAPRLALALDAICARYAGRVFGFDDEAAHHYGRVMGEAERKGRKMATPDGMIAAIALQHDSPLATRNMPHFAIEGLRLINPWAD